MTRQERRLLRRRIADSYKEALKNSPRWVRLAFRAYMVLPLARILKQPFQYFFNGNKGTPPFKMAQWIADYGKPPEHKKSQRCGNCIFAWNNVLDRDIDICSQLRGKINLGLWCSLWKGKR